MNAMGSSRGENVATEQNVEDREAPRSDSSIWDSRPVSPPSGDHADMISLEDIYIFDMTWFQLNEAIVRVNWRVNSL